MEFANEGKIFTEAVLCSLYTTAFEKGMNLLFPLLCFIIKYLDQMFERVRTNLNKSLTHNNHPSSKFAISCYRHFSVI